MHPHTPKDHSHELQLPADPGLICIALINLGHLKPLVCGSRSSRECVLTQQCHRRRAYGDEIYSPRFNASQTGPHPGRSSNANAPLVHAVEPPLQPTLNHGSQQVPAVDSCASDCYRSAALERTESCREGPAHLGSARLSELISCLLSAQEFREPVLAMLSYVAEGRRGTVTDIEHCSEPGRNILQARPAVKPSSSPCRPPHAQTAHTILGEEDSCVL